MLIFSWAFNHNWISLSNITVQIRNITFIEFTRSENRDCHKNPIQFNIIFLNSKLLLLIINYIKNLTIVQYLYIFLEKVFQAFNRNCKKILVIEELNEILLHSLPLVS